MDGSRWTFEAIGTVWHIDVPELSDEVRKNLTERITKRIEEFDKNYSRFRDDSLVTRMSREAGKYTLPDDAKPLMDLYVRLYQETAGKFTPLIGQVLVDAGYDAQYSLQSKIVSKPPKLEEVLEYDFPTLTLKQPALLDFGAVGKGYLVDIVADMIEEVPSSSSSLASYCVDAGGDMRLRMSSDRPSRVGLENPDDSTQVIGVAELSSGAICGSAGNRRAWKAGEKEWHHIIDPDALVSPRLVKAVWVTAPRTIITDALTTCFYLVEPQTLVDRLTDFSFEYFVLHDDMTFEQSSNFPAEIFIKSV